MHTNISLVCFRVKLYICSVKCLVHADRFLGCLTLEDFCKELELLLLLMWYMLRDFVFNLQRKGLGSLSSIVYREIFLLQK
jgi:hypothetical protein